MTENENRYGTGKWAVHRSEGVTRSEQYLKNLCDRTFLSLWSYPNIFRDEGGGKGSGHGKELCDLFVLFENHAIIFSDKDCKFPNTGKLSLDWSRWFRKAVEEPTRTLWGAERWLRTHPERLFMDRNCTKPLPISLPAITTMRVHRVVVAHGASDRCKAALGGSGSLMIDPDVVGEMHYERPFAIGQLDQSKGYVHVFDDTSLDIAMTTLDTVRDFVAYLGKKEDLIASGNLGMAAGEEELIAYYLRNLRNGEHEFIIPEGVTHLVFDEGLWSEFNELPQRRAQLEANRISYSWDALIETFNQHILGDTQYFQSHPGVANQEKITRFLARENRTRRRLLAKSLLEMIHTTPHNYRRTRVILPSRKGDPHYVFLLLPRYASVGDATYREVRRELLWSCCLVAKLKFADAEDIVGIATETGREGVRSEDVVYYDARKWSAEVKEEALSLQKDLGLLTDVKMFRGVVNEFPLPDAD